MSENKTYVREDEHGVLRVSDTRVMLDSIVASFEQGHSPESIQQQYPALTLEEVYGAITYCLSHREEVAAYLERQRAVWERLRAAGERQPSQVVQRLRDLQNANAAKSP
jgi:uncharacterized protein (DUF433 family)